MNASQTQSEIFHNTSPSQKLPKPPSRAAGESEAQKAPNEGHYDLPADGGSKEMRAHGNVNCNGFSDDAEGVLSWQENTSASSIAANPPSEETQQTANSPKQVQAAAQERQQRVVQFLIEGCDELANDHQQVCYLP